jgi:hypothetical protein
VKALISMRCKDQTQAQDIPVGGFILDNDDEQEIRNELLELTRSGLINTRATISAWHEAKN